jgi:hypothetical protein
MMRQYVETALAAPIFDPEKQVNAKFFWWADRHISAGLTCNIGME